MGRAVSRAAGKAGRSGCELGNVQLATRTLPCHTTQASVAVAANRAHLLSGLTGPLQNHLVVHLRREQRAGAVVKEQHWTLVQLSCWLNPITSAAMRLPPAVPASMPPHRCRRVTPTAPPQQDTPTAPTCSSRRQPMSRSASSASMRSMAAVAMSAALPWMGVLMAARSACPCAALLPVLASGSWRWRPRMVDT